MVWWKSIVRCRASPRKLARSNVRRGGLEIQFIQLLAQFFGFAVVFVIACKFHAGKAHLCDSARWRRNPARNRPAQNKAGVRTDVLCGTPSQGFRLMAAVVTAEVLMKFRRVTYFISKINVVR